MSRFLYWLAFITVLAASSPALAQPFPDYRENDKPSSWTGRVFKLSQDYPATRPAAETLAWKTIDFKTQPAAYLQSVLNYCYQGNIESDWTGDGNTVRKWYHAPWLHPGLDKGREFIRGTTRERTTPARRLHPNQSTPFGAFAVGLYNPRGGYTIGQVWKDHENPDSGEAIFPDGSVACKLIFTMATVAQVPYLAGSVEWEVNGAVAFGGTRSPMTVRLLQIDVAVKDSRASGTTGWVFGTFNYNSAASGARPWDKMVPVGLMWGNDPLLTPAKYRTGSRPQQSKILFPNVMTNPATDWKGVGWLERLNGPIDNPQSACLSCHMTAAWRRTSGMVNNSLSFNQVTSNATLDPDVVTQKMRWFKNIKRQPFDAGQESLDYSLQLHDGIENFCAANTSACNSR